MSFKTTAEIEASFRTVERMLDAMLGEARAFLEHERITVRDESNRSGFDWVSPYFVWAFDFERQEAYGSEIKRAAARLWYREAVDEEARMIKITSLAEIFQLGKQSRVWEPREQVYPIGEFLGMRMEQVIMDCIAAAEQVLARY